MQSDEFHPVAPFVRSAARRFSSFQSVAVISRAGEASPSMSISTRRSGVFTSSGRRNVVSFSVSFTGAANTARRIPANSSRRRYNSSNVPSKSGDATIFFILLSQASVGGRRVADYPTLHCIEIQAVCQCRRKLEQNKAAEAPAPAALQFAYLMSAFTCRDTFCIFDRCRTSRRRCVRLSNLRGRRRRV